MRGTVNLTLEAELNGTRVQIRRARSLDELRAMRDTSQAFRIDCDDLITELRPHWGLLVEGVPHGTDKHR